MDLSWYATLAKPFFNPPPWVFGPAWTILYILIAISGILILKKGLKKKGVKHALKLFLIQLGLNLAWSPTFFGLHQIFLSLMIIVFMWYFIFLTAKSFYKIDKIAGYLLWPYLAWVSFATILNFSVWILNR